MFWSLFRRFALFTIPRVFSRYQSQANFLEESCIGFLGISMVFLLRPLFSSASVDPRSSCCAKPLNEQFSPENEHSVSPNLPKVRIGVLLDPKFC